MPRKLIKRYMPNEAQLKSHPHLGRLGRHLHNPNLWHLNRSSVSLAFLVGVFCAFLPIPMQMLVAAGMAILVHSNLPISVGLVWITNPLTMPPIFYFTYLVGNFLLQRPEDDVPMAWTLEWLTTGMASIWWPLLLGSVVCGVVFGLLGYFGIRLFWIWHVSRSWRQRQKRRQPNGSDSANPS